MTQVVLTFRWYLVVQAFGLAVLPLCLRLFRHFPDRGYGVSKPLGLLLTGWAFWLLTTFGWTRNTAGGIFVALALLLAVCLLLRHGAPNVRHPPLDLMLTTELVFALAFIVWCVVRAHMPRIETAGGEKWMEIAFLRAILRSGAFPPHDPWLSGFAISYYYFGYLIVAMITRLAAVPPSIAFNLGIATLFALVCTGAFSLVYNLIAAEGRSEARSETLPNARSETLPNARSETLPNARSETSPNKVFAILGGLLGPLLVTVMGNLEGLLEMLHARGVGPSLLWQWLDIGSISVAPPPFAGGSWVPTRFFWWWQASRVLRDYTPWGAAQEVIDEFPAFSFILGDMHPHLLALPFVLLALALALNLYLRTMNDASRLALHVSRSAPLPLALWEFLVYAICLGGLGFLNTWDFPIYLFVVAAAYVLAHLHTTPHASRLTFHISRFALIFIPLLVVGVLLYLPFWIGFQSQASGILINLFNPTRLPQFLVMFGPLVFIAAVFVAGQARRGGVRGREVIRWTVFATLGILGVLAFVLAVVVALVWLGVVPPRGASAYLAAWLRGEPIPGLEGMADAHTLISRSLLSRLLNPWVALVLIAFLVTIALVLTRHTRHVPRPPAIRNFSLLLFATGAFLTLSVEYIYLRDIFGTRMNTVFKFYFQAWVVWGIAGAYALAGFVRRARPERGRRGRVGVMIAAILLVIAGLVYPALAIPARAGEYGGPPTLDGAAYLAEIYPADYAAITWLNEHVAGAPVILEAPGDNKAYVYEGRVSAHTGLPTLLGWAGHEHQWRGSYDEQARREPDIETLYTSVDLGNEVLPLLDKYGISYVYVGPLERKRYPAAGLAKFAGALDVVYDADGVTIYRVRENE